MVRKSRKRAERLRELHKSIISELDSGYPNLYAYVLEDRVVVKGTFAVRDKGIELDRYTVEIRVPLRFPADLPALKEVGGRIPRTSDFHTNPDGTACLYIEEALSYELAKPIETLTDYLEGPVRNYFIGQSLVAKGGTWPFGEHDHGADGIKSVYSKLLGTNDTNEIRRYLQCFSQSKVKGHFDCPCGSGKRIRDCHQERLTELSKVIKPILAKRALQYMARSK
jgi:hypothetical protein